MKEVDVQKLIVDAVRAHGGAAHKLSNRFLVGVSDLLVKLPSYPAMLVEVKMNKFGVNHHGAFKLGVTKLQETFMRDYQNAGMAVVVMSFIEKGHKGVRGLYCSTFRLDVAYQHHVQVRGHTLLGGPGERERNVIKRLENFHGGARR